MQNRTYHFSILMLFQKVRRKNHFTYDLERYSINKLHICYEVTPLKACWDTRANLLANSSYFWTNFSSNL
jgi:hypothetical protein